MYGIDFGTSNTVVCTKNDKGGIDLIDFGQGETIIPTLIYMDIEGKLSIGREAMADYSIALERWSLEDDPYNYFRFFQAPKLALKDPGFLGTKVFGELWTTEKIVGEFLRQVKQKADEITGKDEKEVVIGRPVELSKNRGIDKMLENRLREAAFLAGFETVFFVYEPIAAAVSLLGKDVGTTLIFDFGGGTLDISIAITDSNKFNILASVGEMIGGYNLSERISAAKAARYFGSGSTYKTLDDKVLQIPHNLTSQVSSFYSLPLSNISETRKTINALLPYSLDRDLLLGLDSFLAKNQSFKLFSQIDKTKILLSQESQALLVFRMEPFVDLKELVLKSEFEEWVSDLVVDADILIDESLVKAGLRCNQVDKVIRVGGSSQTPIFKTMIDKKFPGKVSDGELFTSISAGLIDAFEKGLSVDA